MRLISYRNNDRWSSGIVVGDSFADCTVIANKAGWSPDDVARAHTVRGLLELGTTKIDDLAIALAKNHAELEDAGIIQTLANARLGPPIPNPRKIICIGLNYYDHAEEVGAEPPEAPIFFAKFDNSLIGPEDEIVPPHHTTMVDYEAELAVVIGRRVRNVSEADALPCVFGGMAFNDVSARDLQFANQLWTGGKAIDTFGPCGPALVSHEELGNLQDLTIRTWVDGRLVQDGNTSTMIFSVAQIVSFLSRIMTLVPGDIIATGTPAGVGVSKKPPCYLDFGSVVEIEIEGIGRIRNTVVDDALRNAAR